MTSNMPFAWPAEAVETLKAEWAAGKSASQIAAIIGNGVTRSAICGKVRRLALQSRPPVPPPPPKRKKNAPHLPVIRRERPSFETAPLPDEELGNDFTARIGLLEASDNMGCMYCSGDPLTPHHSFCNEPRKPGTAWCEDHYSIVYPGARS